MSPTGLRCIGRFHFYRLIKLTLVVEKKLHLRKLDFIWHASSAGLRSGDRIQKNIVSVHLTVVVLKNNYIWEG